MKIKITETGEIKKVTLQYYNGKDFSDCDIDSDFFYGGEDDFPDQIDKAIPCFTEEEFEERMDYWEEEVANANIGENTEILLMLTTDEIERGCKYVLEVTETDEDAEEEKKGGIDFNWQDVSLIVEALKTYNDKTVFVDARWQAKAVKMLDTFKDIKNEMGMRGTLRCVALYGNLEP